ncbi:carbohydrate-binding domain-containing protein [Vescimonas sp.]|uniref:carbohydrate-binding domain-containing protein n=1 Tax=Vescimonas sp. TaxID=2892404 RepID=UPI00307C7DA6
MSTGKHFSALCALVLALALAVTVLFMNGEKLGIRVVRDEDSETNEDSGYFTTNDQNTAWTAATTITLSGDTATVSGSGAYANGGSVTIASAGYYDVTGTLTDGSLIVDAGKNAKVFLRLNGVTITSSDDAAIRVNQADKVFLTLAEGTENTVTSGETYSEAALADKADGAIFAHDDLTINGSGALTVTAAYKHGIAANDSLRITGGKITVTAPADTIHVNDSLHITGAAITLSAGDDAIHSGTSVAILGGSITVNTCCEGIEAPEILVEDGAVTVTSTDDGINACGTETSDGSLPGVTINGGTVTLLNPSGRDADGIDSNGNIDINGGLVYISLIGDGGNCALDYGSENGGACRINGGTVVACGGSTMLEAMSENSAQPSLLYAGTTQAAGTEITLQDSSGKILLTYAAPNSFSAVLVSCPEMATGSTYTLTLGDTAQEIPLTQVATTYGVSGGMGGDRGGNMGGGMGDMGGRGGMNGGSRGSTPTSGTADSATDDTALPGGSGTPPTKPDGDSDPRPSGEAPTRPDGEDGTTDGTDRPTPPDGDMGGTMPAAPDGSADGRPVTPRDGQPTPDQQTETGESFTLDKNGKVLLLASAATLALGLTVAFLYRKKG